MQLRRMATRALAAAAGASRWLSVPVGTVGLTLLVLVLTARLTLLDVGYDQRALARTHAVERLYTEVLPGPTAQTALRDAFRPLPVDPDFLTANTRLLLPPNVLEQTLNHALSELVRYLLGGSDHVDTQRIVQPVVDHVTKVSHQLLPGVVTAAPRITTGSLERFDVAFERFVSRLEAGLLPDGVPVLPLSTAEAADVASTITAGLPDDQRVKLSGQVRVLLAEGRIADAIALVAPAYAAEHPGLAGSLSDRMSAIVQTLRDPLHRLRSEPSVRSIRTLHRVLPTGTWSVALLGLLLFAVATIIVAARARRHGRSVVAALFYELTGVAVLSLVVGLLLLHALPDPLRTAASSADVPTRLAAILTDVDGELRHGVVRTYLELIGAVGADAAALGLALAVPHLHRLRGRVPLRAVLAAGGVAAIGLLVAAIPGGGRQTTCNGYASLCVVPYDGVTYLAAHNAMASSDAGFVDAAQDPDITGQLDAGVRALLLDFHRWTTPERVSRYLSRLSPATRQVLAPALTTLPPRPGVWLCHIVCQLGATPAVDAMQELRRWLASHRDAVVTLIIEDHTTLDETRATLEKAGLRHYVQTPPEPGVAWPTLGRMVATNHRLVVFTERNDWPDGWIRNYHFIGAETPFDVPDRAALSCAQGRGPARAPLFLLNNWVATTPPSRAIAAQVNAPAALMRRVRQCDREREMLPTYIAVDFAQIGDPIRVVDRLNRVSPAR